MFANGVEGVECTEASGAPRFYVGKEFQKEAEGLHDGAAHVAAKVEDEFGLPSCFGKAEKVMVSSYEVGLNHIHIAEHKIRNAEDGYLIVL